MQNGISKDDRSRNIETKFETPTYLPPCAGLGASLSRTTTLGHKFVESQESSLTYKQEGTRRTRDRPTIAPRPRPHAPKQAHQIQTGTQTDAQRTLQYQTRRLEQTGHSGARHADTHTGRGGQRSKTHAATGTRQDKENQQRTRTTSEQANMNTDKDNQETGNERAGGHGSRTGR